MGMHGFSFDVNDEVAEQIKSFQEKYKDYNPDGGPFEYYYSRKGMHYFRNRHRTIIIAWEGKVPFKKGTKLDINPAPVQQGTMPLTFSTSVSFSSNEIM